MSFLLKFVLLVLLIAVPVLGATNHRVLGATNHRVLGATNHRVLGATNHRVPVRYVIVLRMFYLLSKCVSAPS